MFLAVVNESRPVETAAVSKAVRTCAAPIKVHVAPVWNMVPASVQIWKKAIKEFLAARSSRRRVRHGA